MFFLSFFLAYLFVFVLAFFRQIAKVTAGRSDV